MLAGSRQAALAQVALGVKAPVAITAARCDQNRYLVMASAARLRRNPVNFQEFRIPGEATEGTANALRRLRGWTAIPAAPHERKQS
jgi:hypothetical protein